MGETWETTTFPRRFEGSVKLPSPYKGPPTKAVEEAWEKLTPLHLMRIRESEFQNVNASKYSSQLYDEEGGRIAVFEAFHMIHCVKSLWQNTYPEYFSEIHAYNQANQDEWHEHTDHCADMLRQKLMCEADSSLITYNWLKNHYYPHPNFNVEHQCRNYDRLLEVSEIRRVGRSFLRPEGKTVIDFVEEPFDPEAES
ncbi:hypothetical protein DM02DRAFT_661360 [Periconia macrospinosa]|uniref:Uncharacterized protein n=1 Tax=Periconia macrospinosa TaxID=97972 RepID=A0A2V1D7T0_9PLEO|nr:hypothetical protein DM02DRAFT_661360 [Periconia macrospinosa]